MSNFPESFVAKGHLKFFTLFLSQNDNVIGSKRIERFFHRFPSHHRIFMVFNWVLRLNHISSLVNFSRLRISGFSINVSILVKNLNQNLKKESFT